MAKSPKQMKAEVKENYLTKISDFLCSLDEEVMRTASGTIAFPIVFEDGNEGFVSVQVSIPSGSRNSDGYNGYAEAESYKIECANQAEKAENARKAKEEKIAKDKARREHSAKIRAEREKRKGN